MQSRLVAYGKLPHFTPLALVVVVTGLLAWMIGGSSLTGSELGRMLLAMLGGQIVIGVVNELVDSETDRLSKQSKPMATGMVSRRGAYVLGTVGLVLMLVAGVSLGVPSFLLLLAGTGTGVAYSVWFKRSRFAWLPYLIALPLLPIWVAVTLGRFESALLLLFPLGAMAVVGVQIAQSIPDIESDRTAGIDSVTTRLGGRHALLLCWLSILGSLGLAFLAGTIRGGWQRPMELAALIVLGLIALDVLVVRWNRHTGVMAAFPCAAVSAAVLALGWMASIYR